MRKTEQAPTALTTHIQETSDTPIPPQLRRKINRRAKNDFNYLISIEANQDNSIDCVLLRAIEDAREHNSIHAIPRMVEVFMMLRLSEPPKHLREIYTGDEQIIRIYVSALEKTAFAYIEECLKNSHYFTNCTAIEFSD